MVPIAGRGDSRTGHANSLPLWARRYGRRVQYVLVATDSDGVYDEVEAALDDGETNIGRVRSGNEVRATVREHDPDLVVLDLQIGAMGGIAACLDLRLEQSAQRLPTQHVMLLLDREADVFLARHSGADAWVLKPLDPRRVRNAATAVLGGGTWMELVDTVAV